MIDRGRPSLVRTVVDTAARLDAGRRRPRRSQTRAERGSTGAPGRVTPSVTAELDDEVVLTGAGWAWVTDWVAKSGTSAEVVDIGFATDAGLSLPRAGLWLITLNIEARAIPLNNGVYGQLRLYDDGGNYLQNIGAPGGLAVSGWYGLACSDVVYTERHGFSVGFYFHRTNGVTFGGSSRVARFSATYLGDSLPILADPPGS